MAYYHARSAVTRSDAAVSNLVNRPMTLTVGGTSRKGDALQRVGLSLSMTLDGGSPSVCSFQVSGTKPAYGAPVLVQFGGVTLWGGTVMNVRADMRGPSLVQWQVQAVDYSWLMNRYSRVNARYRNLGVNTIAASVLATYTDAASGFTPGYLPSSLGTVAEITFEDETVTGALAKLAKAANNAAGAYWRIRPDKAVDIATTFPDGVTLTLANSSNVRELQYEESLSSIRTRAIVKARGTRTTAVTNISGTTVSVEECERFVSTGGSARHGWDTFAYTGVSAASGPGDLTGVSGLSDDIPQGATVVPVVQSDDSTAQTNLATTLGSSQSGIAVDVLTADHLGADEAASLAAADVQMFKAALPALQYTLIRPSATVRNHWPGATISASVTTPLTISGDFRIQSVTISDWDVLSSTTDPTLRAVVTARGVKRQDLLDLLGVAG